MATLRRLYCLLSCLLAALLTVGTASPGVSQWQCHHAAHIVNAPLSAMPTQMPCRMGAPMPGMACCLPPSAKTAFRTQQSLSRAACHPTLTRLTLLPAPGLPGAQILWSRSLLSAQAAMPLPAALLPSVPLICALRPRPPPALPLCASAPEHAPGLRAPPAA